MNKKMKQAKNDLYRNLGVSEKKISDTEKRWISTYCLQHNDSAIALKALDLFGMAIKTSIFGDGTREILDVLMDKVINSSSPKALEKLTPTYEKINEAQRTLSNRGYLLFMAMHFDEWSAEVRLGITNDDKELITNAVNYTVSTEKAIIGHLLTLFELNQEVLT